MIYRCRSQGLTRSMTGACERQFSPETGDLLAVCVAGADAHARPFMWDGKTLRMSHVRLVGAPGLSSGVTMRCPVLLSTTRTSRITGRGCRAARDLGAMLICSRSLNALRIVRGYNHGCVLCLSVQQDRWSALLAFARSPDAGLELHRRSEQPHQPIRWRCTR